MELEIIDGAAKEATEEYCGVHTSFNAKMVLATFGV